jgi:glutathione peroxidase
MKALKYTAIGVLALVAFTITYSLFTQRNAVHMTTRQKILKTVYPAFMWATKLFNTNRDVLRNPGKPSLADFYSLPASDISGAAIDLHSFRGKKILIVNTASDCGYTAQFDELEQLYRSYGNKLTVIAFPANDFKEQEKGDAASIASFCRKNYGVSFPLMEKAVVIPGAAQHPVYQWLTRPQQNGWNQQAPSWNFAKYLLDEQGNLQAYFGPSVSPLSTEITSLLK